MNMRTVCVIAALSLALLTNFTVIDLPTPAGIVNSQAFGVNDRGDVVGRAESSTFGSAMAWLDGGVGQAIPTTANCLQMAEDINDNQQVAGTMWVAPPGMPCGGFAAPNAFFWQPGMATATSFGSGAHSLNKAADIAGESSDGSYVQAAVWPAAGPAPTYLTWYGGAARSIDNAPVVAGEMRSKSGFSHAFLWIDTYLQDLGTLGGPTSAAYRVTVQTWPDPSGLTIYTVGNADLAPSGGATYTHAFLYNYGSMTDLGTLPGDVNSYAYGINRSLVIVGASYSATGTSRAFIAKPGSGMYDLNAVYPVKGWLYTIARDVNDAGYIVGEGLHNGVRRAFLIIP